MMDFAPLLPVFLAAYAILFVLASSQGPAGAVLLGISTRHGGGPALGACAAPLSAAPVRRAYEGGRQRIRGTLGTFFAFAAYKLATTRI